jgi:hypothetical protein
VLAPAFLSSGGRVMAEYYYFAFFVMGFVSMHTALWKMTP